MDLSLEAIEQDLNRAEQALGRPEAAIHSQRALIRATLRGQTSGDPSANLTPLTIGPDTSDIHIVEVAHGKVYFVPDSASVRDREEAASQMIGAIVVEPEDEDDDAEDVFAEVRKAKKK